MSVDPSTLYQKGHVRKLFVVEKVPQPPTNQAGARRLAHGGTGRWIRVQDVKVVEIVRSARATKDVDFAIDGGGRVARSGTGHAKPVQEDGWGGVFVVRIWRINNTSSHRSRSGCQLPRVPIGPGGSKAPRSGVIHRCIVCVVVLLIAVERPSAGGVLSNIITMIPLPANVPLGIGWNESIVLLISKCVVMALMLLILLVLIRVYVVI